jgi:phage shock protein PspC (stress-responsive transcriptional regulator)
MSPDTKKFVNECKARIAQTAEIERLRGVVTGASKYFGVDLEAISYAP